MRKSYLPFVTAHELIPCTVDTANRASSSNLLLGAGGLARGLAHDEGPDEEGRVRHSGRWVPCGSARRVCQLGGGIVDQEGAGLGQLQQHRNQLERVMKGHGQQLGRQLDGFPADKATLLSLQRGSSLR